MLTFDGCDPGANPWVEKYFHDCVMDYRDAIGFALGLCSIFVWLTAQIPQFLSNVKNQSSEALSIWFLVEWFAGDTLNLLGCLIQGQQLPTTTILAAYFVLMDVIMLLQYIYYGALQARRKRLRARASRKRHGHRHASAAHHHNRDESYLQVAPLLNDGGTNHDFSELSSGPESSTVATPVGGSVKLFSESGGSVAAASRKGLLTLTAATAAGLSVVCMAVFAFHPDAATSPLRFERHLLSLNNQHQDPTAVHDGAGGDDFGAGGISSSGAGNSRSSVATFRLAATGTGAALSLVGRSLASVFYPPAFGGTFLRSGSSDSDSGGGDDSRSPGACSFLNCDVALVAGTVMGYLSTCFYLASRVSQIRKNLARRSTEGLSPVMFVLTMSANMCTGVSIVLRLRSLEQVKEQLPWMCGTFGTIALDMTLFYQAITLGHEHCHGHGHQHSHHGHSHAHGHCHGAGNGHDLGKPVDLEAPLLIPVPSNELGENSGSEPTQQD
ncbi:hypothetical protein Vretimale_15280 [Volvox reticuliferus]|uniref:Uncharacterized protein n=1 Tax=Volvox reticuliferus TaxID=1737510 RepID=A0A8J4LW56_9CHLO|nr:hypothetical protein Vretifemale_5480 [Volvox reticuliferus]GIM11821.1 hypothetical protein Vretimale_15280 [Volvox reticuliferus]